MMPDRWQRIEELYHSAREREESQRVAFLEEACEGDEALRREVESLLAEEKRAEGFLESPALEIAAKKIAQDQTRSLLGQRLGSYQVLSLLGAGGMGEVYRGRDSNLRRDIAIKVLPKSFVDDPDRLGRFRREAQVLASLNHPNIATIHGLEQSDGVHYLVMELVAGETLAERIERAGALPISETLFLCRQIAEALEAAHEKGVVHRDLKPANVKVTPEGRVKVLDFGLAKAFSGDGSGTDSSNGATLTEMGTQPGAIVGTPSYMSPEQARGKAVDKRTDIWAFGCVLYELLTGRQAFRGETSADSIAAVLEKEPDWNVLPPTISAQIRYLLRRCLQKDVNRRLHDIADARIEIEEALASPATGELEEAVGALPRWRRVTRLGVIFSAAAAIAAVAVWGLRVMTLPAPQPISRFTVTLPPDRPLALVPAFLAISPDGTHLVYAAIRGGTSQLYLRPLDQMEATPIEGAEDGTFPFFSPDGQWLGFFADGKLKKTPISGGPPVVLCDAAGGRGGSWGENGTIIFAPEARGGIYLLSSAGGTPRVLATPDSNKGETSYRSPSFLPGGNEVLFTVLGTTRTDVHIVVQSLKTGERRVLIRGGDAKDQARYVPTGYLVYSQNGTLLAAPFDTRRLELTGTPMPVVEDIAKDISGQFSFSRLGSLVYIPRAPRGGSRTLVWVDRKGVAQSLPVPPHRYWQPRFSPDGRRLAVHNADDAEIWLYDIPRETFSRLTFGGNSGWPTWSPDGKRLTFGSIRAGRWAILWKPADGSGPDELLMMSEHSAIPQAWSPDGRLLAFLEDNARTGLAIGVLPLGGQRQPRPFLQTPFTEIEPTFSPDGRWLAYASNESGRFEVYVQSFPSPGGKWQISTEGGREPVWARNGGELFYRDGGKMMVVDLTTKSSFRAAKPRALFEGHYVVNSDTTSYDVTPDGQRFVMIKPSEQELAATQINVVLNWFEDLKRRVGPGAKQ